MNIAYADGHVKWLRKGQLNYCVHIKDRGVPRDIFGNDQASLWGPGGTCETYQ